MNKPQLYRVRVWAALEGELSVPASSELEAEEWASKLVHWGDYKWLEPTNFEVLSVTKI